MNCPNCGGASTPHSIWKDGAGHQAGYYRCEACNNVFQPPEEAVQEAPAADEDPPEDLTALTLDELKKRAEEAGVEGFEDMDAPALIDALNAAKTASEERPSAPPRRAAPRRRMAD